MKYGKLHMTFIKLFPLSIKYIYIFISVPENCKYFLKLVSTLHIYLVPSIIYKSVYNISSN